jgi:hypothetical protein
LKQLLEMKMGGNPILVEVDDQSQEQVTYRNGKESITKKLDLTLDKMFQDKVIAYCETMNGACEQLLKQPFPPKKIVSEFGLQINAEGNLFVAKLSGQSSFKISIEWELRRTTEENVVQTRSI